MGGKPRRPLLHAIARAALATAALVTIAERAAAEPIDPGAALAASTGASPCTLIEGVPAPTHPLRKNAAVARHLAALDHAGLDAAKADKAYAQLVKELDRLLASSKAAFVPPPRGKAFQLAPARRFLERYVLAANAIFRVGLERFEPAPELAAVLALGACRAGRWDDVVALGRASTLPEVAPQRALAALVLTASGRVEEARELAPHLGDGFLASLVRVELEADPARRLELHALAGRGRVNADQDLAWRLQGQRLRGATP